MSLAPENGPKALIFVEVNWENITVTPDRISKVVDQIQKQNGMVFHILSTILIGGFAMDSADGSPPFQRCEECVKAIAETVPNCKIIYGESTVP